MNHKLIERWIIMKSNYYHKFQIFLRIAGALVLCVMLTHELLAQQKDNVKQELFRELGAALINAHEEEENILVDTF